MSATWGAKGKGPNVRHPPLRPAGARIPLGIHYAAHHPARARCRRGYGVPQSGDQEGRQEGDEVLCEVCVGALRAVEAVGGGVLFRLLGRCVGVGVRDSLTSRFDSDRLWCVVVGRRARGEFFFFGGGGLIRSPSWPWRSARRATGLRRWWTRPRGGRSWLIDNVCVSPRRPRRSAPAPVFDEQRGVSPIFVWDLECDGHVV